MIRTNNILLFYGFMDSVMIELLNKSMRTLDKLKILLLCIQSEWRMKIQINQETVGIMVMVEAQFHAHL